MPAKKKATRKTAKKPTKSFEETLWETANNPDLTGWARYQAAGVEIVNRA